MPRLLSQPRVQTLLRESKDKATGRRTRKKMKESRDLTKRRRKETTMRTSPVLQRAGAAWSGGAGSARRDTQREMIISTT